MQKLTILLIIIVLYSCKNDVVMVATEGDPIVNIKAADGKLANPDNLEFKFSIDTSYQYMEGEMMHLNCTLYNGNLDTLYFFTYSCVGWQDNFIVDTNNVQIYKWIDCNINEAIIKKVAPKSNFEFKGYLLVKEGELKDIQVQYYIYQISPDFNVRNSDSVRKLEKTIIKNTYKTN